MKKKKKKEENWITYKCTDCTNKVGVIKIHYIPICSKCGKYMAIIKEPK